MSKFKFTQRWQASGNDAPEFSRTTAMLALHIGNVNLMRNEDIWSKTVCDSVLVSAYPLAMWLASSWWRLNWEPLPVHGHRPTVDWRMAHELGAANHGFVWPQIIFASDSEEIQVWSAASNANSLQSVRYLNGLDIPSSIALTDFQRGVEDFICSVLSRLNAMGSQDTDLSNLWQLIKEDRADPLCAKYRRIEAEMGYDPDECPEALMEKALALEQQMGIATLSELAPVYGKSAYYQAPLTSIEEIAKSPGLIGKPTYPRPSKGATVTHAAPWQRAVAAAEEMRQALGNRHDMIDNANLYELLGLSESAVEHWSSTKRNAASIAVPYSDDQYKFMPRKNHPLAKRFELARFLGDHLWAGHTYEQWLAITDLSTARQKYQRAFAAELLCPINALQEFLQDDFSEDTIEEAGQHFQVSSKTVDTLLVNNGLVSPFYMTEYAETRLPYRMGI